MKQDISYWASPDDSSAPNIKNENPSNEPSNLEMGSMSKIRTLVAINQRKNLEAALTYLERNYYQLRIVNTMPDLILGLQQHRPQIVLLSWNLKNTDVKRVYRLLTEKFHLVCVVFAEDNGTRTTASLMSSGIPHSLLAPVSGQGIHMRIQSLLAPRMRPRKRPVAPKFLSRSNKVQADRSKVPSDMTWNEVDDPQNEGEKLWQGVGASGDSKGKIYFFKGKAPPTYDHTKKEWDHEKSKGGIYFEEREPSENDEFDWDSALKSTAMELAATQMASGNEIDGPAPAEIKSQDKGGVTVQEKAEPYSGDLVDFGTPLKSKNSHGPESLLAQSLKNALAQHSPLPVPPLNEQAPVSSMAVCTLNSSRFCGYIVCVSSDNKTQKRALKDLMAVVKHELIQQGEELLKPLEFLEVSVDAVPFMPWAESKADFSIASKTTGLALAFFSTSGQPQIIEAQDESVFGVPLGKGIIADTKLPFNVYIHLAKNSKYLLYLPKGRLFTKDMQTKFVGFGVKTIFVRKVEKEDFLAYCAQNFIKATIK